MSNELLQTRAGRFFWWVTERPRIIIAVCAAIVIAVGIWIPWLGRDASAEAFIPSDDPAVVYRQKVREIFGLSDPLVVLVTHEGPKGVFNPDTLRLITWLTDRISELEGVNPQRMTSLSTEDDVVGTDESIEVRPFFERPPDTQEATDAVRDAVMDFDLYVGNLVSQFGDATLIIAELEEYADGNEVYEQTLALVEDAPIGDERVDVAGEGAVATALGLMAATGVPFYVITNALPVILIAIGVADSVHILGQYYEEAAARPDDGPRELTVRTMVQMWRPVTITSLTDMAAFIAIFVASVMPPMQAFGFFCAVGSGAALMMSVLFLPACLVLMRTRTSPAFARRAAAADIVVDTGVDEGLFRPENLERIEALQEHVCALPNVNGAVSFLDFLKQMNRAVNEDDRAAYVLPDSEELTAQYFLLFSASGENLEHVADYNHRLANIRIAMDSGLYTDGKVVVESAERYIAEHFNRPKTDGAPALSAHLAGRVNVDYHWLGQLSKSHFRSVFAALVVVWLMLAVSFRSLTAGLFALAPVCLAVLLIYAVMGFAGIWLSVGTSMFAAIAIGTGVDFAAHSVDRLIVLTRKEGRSLEEAFDVLFPSTGRALLFNFAAVFLGFGLLTTSHVPPLIRFGVLITISIGVSFLASLTMLPALVKVVRPAFVTARRSSYQTPILGKVVASALGLALCFGVAAGASDTEDVTGDLTGNQIGQRVNARDDGKQFSRKLVMEMIDRSGKTRTRVTRTFRKYFDDEKRIAIFYLEPKNIRGTAFLNVDHDEPGRDDDRWLYLPAARKIRRIAAADRGDYFLGTDFTYEDIDNETKVNIPDYGRKALGRETIEGHECLVMEAIPVNDDVAKELGYGRVVSWVDPQTWMLRKADYWDTRGGHLKTVYFQEIRQVQGIWTAHRIVTHNHSTNHKTILISSEVDYQKAVDDDLFTKRALRRGP